LPDKASDALPPLELNQSYLRAP